MYLFPQWALRKVQDLAFVSASESCHLLCHCSEGPIVLDRGHLLEARQQKHSVRFRPASPALFSSPEVLSKIVLFNLFYLIFDVSIAPLKVITPLSRFFLSSVEFFFSFDFFFNIRRSLSRRSISATWTISVPRSSSFTIARSVSPFITWSGTWSRSASSFPRSWPWSLSFSTHAGFKLMFKSS